MDAEAFKTRTRHFAVTVISVVDQLPRSVAGNVVARQLVKCGTSVGANYRAACRARSRAEMIAKLQTVHEEADEVGYWLEVALDTRMLPANVVAPLADEASQITAMVVASLKTLRDKQGSSS